MNQLFQYGPIEHKHLFRMWANQHNDIKHFVSGGLRKIIALQRSSIQYPALWYETPDIYFEQNEYQVYDGAFTILINAELECWETEDYLLDKTFHIASDLIKRLIKYAEACKFEIDLKDISINKIDPIGHDNDIGWRVNYKIKVTHELCDRSCKWDDKCDPCMIASFSWNNSPNDEYKCFNIKLSDTSRPVDSALQYNWTWNIDDQSEQSSNEQNPNITGEGTWIFICLEITDENGCKQCASAVFCKKQNCGFSLPFKYKNLKPYC